MWPILVRISHEVFEPMAVGALIGLGFVMYRRWRKSRTESLLFAGILLFMCSWRIGMAMNADRYALLLVPPAIFLTAFAMRELAVWFRRFAPRVPWCFLFFLSMFIAAAVVSFRGNREDRAFFSLLKVLQREIRAENGPVTVVSPRNFSAFLDRRVNMVSVMHWPDYLQYRRILQPSSSAPCYVIFRINRKEVPSADVLAELKLIASDEGRGRRKFSYFLWKVVPDPDRQFLRLPDAAAVEAHAAPGGNLLANAGFEQSRPAKETRGLAARYVSLGAVFYRKPGLKLPAGWKPFMQRIRPGRRVPEFELSSADPIRGKYSLRTNIEPRMPLVFGFPRRLPAGDYVYSLTIRAKKNARFRLFFHAFRKGKYQGERNIAFVTVPADGTWFVSVPVRRSDLTEGDAFSAAIGGQEGEMFFDEVALRTRNPVEKQTRKGAEK